MMSGFKPITEKDVWNISPGYDTYRQSFHKDDVLSALAGLRERVDVPNPYPVDVFPELSPKELPLIDDVLRREFGFPLDRLSAFIGRRLFENYKKKTLEDIDYYFQLASEHRPITDYDTYRQSFHKDDVLSALAGLRENVDVPNPYPISMFPDIDKETCIRIDRVLKKELGFSLDLVSGNVGRRLFENYKKKMLEDMAYWFNLKEV